LEVANIFDEFKEIHHQPSDRRLSLESLNSLRVVDAQDALERVRARLREFVQHRFFTAGIASLILLNAVYIGMETELVDDSSDVSLGWYLAELAFTIIFLVELCLRIAAAQDLREFTSDSWNLFDLILVVVSCIDTFVLTTITRNVRKVGQSKAISTVRTIRLARIARIFRLLRFFRELWVLVAGIVEAMWTLVWTWILLALLIYVFGIFATRTIGQVSKDPYIEEYFGNVPRSMFSLFQVTTTEGWADIARKAMETQLWTSIFFIIYFYVTTCAILNVVVAVIVENTLDQAGDQRQKFDAKQKRMQKEACSKIYEVFHSLDNNGDGMLTKEEFLLALRQESVTRYLHQIGLDMRQAENLFSILDFDESGSLDAQEFVGGVMKAIGPGRAKDVLALQCDLWRSEEKIWARLQETREGANARMTAVEQGVKELKEEMHRLVQQFAVQRPAPVQRKTSRQLSIVNVSRRGSATGSGQSSGSSASASGRPGSQGSAVASGTCAGVVNSGRPGSQGSAAAGGLPAGIANSGRPGSQGSVGIVGIVNSGRPGSQGGGRPGSQGSGRPGSQGSAGVVSSTREAVSTPAGRNELHKKSAETSAMSR